MLNNNLLKTLLTHIRTLISSLQKLQTLYIKTTHTAHINIYIPDSVQYCRRLDYKLDQ